MALGIMFLPASFWLLALVFMLGGVQVAIEETARGLVAGAMLITRVHQPTPSAFTSEGI